MTWKRALPYIAVAIASCVLTIVVLMIVMFVTAADYLADQIEEFPDLVGAEGGEAYEGNVQIYVENTERIMNDLVLHLPNWIEQASRSSHKGSHL